ncbi:protein YhfH [Bacillus carboniphilus]
MLPNVLEFFRNLPKKQCHECGNAIEEQHECYGNVCENCLQVHEISL